MSPATSENAPDMIPAPAPAPPSPSPKKPSALARATANPRPPAVRLELALAAHAPGTLAIYNREVESGTATFDMAPRSLEEQLEWVAEHSGAHPAVVALSTDGAGEDEVVGFGSLSLYRPEPRTARRSKIPFTLLKDPSGWVSGGRCWKSCSG